VFSRDHWPFAITPRLGIAAIEYDAAEAVDDGGYRTMSMLGCVCQDIADDQIESTQTTRMQIHCSVARYQSEQSEEAMDPTGLHVPITFALTTTAEYLTCTSVKIVVDSVRWPLSRLSKPGSLATGGRSWSNPLSELASEDGTDGPVEADAAIWVIPACRAEGVMSPVCDRLFSKAACFPYCLAVRTKGSASQGLVLYNADDWARNVQLPKRDCSGPHVSNAGLDNMADYVEPGDIPKYYGGVIGDSLDPFGKKIVVGSGFTYDPTNMACVSSDTVSSRLNVSTVASINQRYPAILMDTQPFAVAGGAALIPMYNADGTFAVRVQRLYGDEGTDMFTMVTTHDLMPAQEPCLTLSKCDQLPRDDILSIPYTWFTSPSLHNPAVETRWGFFYAVNPSLDMFEEFFKYCQDKSTKLQIQALSSYGGIRIWRVEAFAYTDGENPTASTGKSIQLPDVFGSSTDDTSVCGNEFNVMVTSMEYLNSNNIAVQVLNAAPAYLNTTTMKPRGNDPQKVTYLTYFLHPVTMQVRQGVMWESDSALGQLSAGSSALCPEWRQMPQFGSMAAEMAASAIIATRMMLSFIITAPTVLQPGMYERIQECPLVPRGHTMLLNCGRNFLNLDASFAAMRVANSHLWNSLAKLGNLIQKEGGTVQTFLTGNAVYNTQVQPLPLWTRVLFQILLTDTNVAYPVQYSAKHPCRLLCHSHFSLRNRHTLHHNPRPVVQ